MSRNQVILLFVGSLIACSAIVATYENRRWSSEVASVTQDNQSLEAELSQVEGQVQALAATKGKQVVVLNRKVASLTSDLAATKAELASTKTELSKANAQATLDSTPTREPPAAAAPSAGCDPNYEGACVPIVDYDLDCADIDGPVYVVGDDVHGFDREGDRVGCENS